MFVNVVNCCAKRIGNAKGKSRRILSMAFQRDATVVPADRKLFDDVRAVSVHVRDARLANGKRHCG